MIELCDADTDTIALRGERDRAVKHLQRFHLFGFAQIDDFDAL